MPRHTNETLTLRTTTELKELLRQAAARERRSVASIVEMLVLAYAEQHYLQTSAGQPDVSSSQKK